MVPHSLLSLSLAQCMHAAYPKAFDPRTKEHHQLLAMLLSAAALEHSK